MFSYAGAPPFPPFTEYPVSIWNDVHVDVRGQLLAGFSYEDRDVAGGLIAVFPSNASGNEPAIYAATAPPPYNQVQGVLLNAATYARSTDDIIGMFTVPDLVAYANTPNTTVLRQFNLDPAFSDTFTAEAVD